MSENPIIKIEDKEALQKSATELLQYPLDIESQGESKLTIFNIYQYNKVEVNKTEFKLSLGSIVLPIPPELNNTDSLNYEEYSAPLLNAAMSYGSEDDLTNSFKKLGKVGVILGASLLGKVPGGDNVVNQVTSLSGSSINPRNTNIFKNPAAREHRYTFKMIAKSKDESLAIRKIVNKFRYHAYPSVGEIDEVIYFAPDLFTIAFKIGKASSDDKDTFLFHPLPSALVAISVSYNGESSPIFFKNTNAPVEVTLQLVFKEMELDNKAKLRERYNINGTTVTQSVAPPSGSRLPAPIPDQINRRTVPRGGG